MFISGLTTFRKYIFLGRHSMNKKIFYTAVIWTIIIVLSLIITEGFPEKEKALGGTGLIFTAYVWIIL